MIYQRRPSGLCTRFPGVPAEEGKMNRRDILKGLTVLPVASALGCRHEDENHQPPSVASSVAPSGFKVKTVQVLLEGPFALVLHRDNPDRLTAFVPRADDAHPDLKHNFYFNDPSRAKEVITKDEGHHFELPTNGLRHYAEPYINPGFNDFLDKTEKWKLPPRVVTIDLPFPGSINVAGRPRRTKFASGKTGMMPTNFILEYYVDEPEKVKMLCQDGACEASPNCPPGVLRFFFGVAPQMKQNEARQKHAVDFFNFMLRTSFPELVAKHALAKIEPSEETNQSDRPDVHPTSGLKTHSSQPLFLPAAMSSKTSRPRLLPVSETVDCQLGGVIVLTKSAPGH